MTDTLPPLPEPMSIAGHMGYSADQLRAYGAACAQAEREQCAKLADERGAGFTVAAIRARSTP